LILCLPVERPFVPTFSALAACWGPANAIIQQRRGFCAVLNAWQDYACSRFSLRRKIGQGIACKARNLLAASLRHWKLAVAWRRVCIQAHSVAALFHCLQTMAKAFLAWCLHTFDAQRVRANEHNVIKALRVASENVSGSGHRQKGAHDLLQPTFRIPWCAAFC
jgi:hypothetical protein